MARLGLLVDWAGFMMGASASFACGRRLCRRRLLRWAARRPPPLPAAARAEAGDRAGRRRPSRCCAHLEARLQVVPAHPSRLMPHLMPAHPSPGRHALSDCPPPLPPPPQRYTRVFLAVLAKRPLVFIAVGERSAILLTLSLHRY